jgi:hypothetical protein
MVIGNDHRQTPFPNIPNKDLKARRASKRVVFPIIGNCHPQTPLPNLENKLWKGHAQVAKTGFVAIPYWDGNRK